MYSMTFQHVHDDVFFELPTMMQPEELHVTMDGTPRFVRFRHLVIVTAFESGGRSLYIRLHVRIGYIAFTMDNTLASRWLRNATTRLRLITRRTPITQNQFIVLKTFY